MGESALEERLLGRASAPLPDQAPDAESEFRRHSVDPGAGSDTGSRAGSLDLSASGPQALGSIGTAHRTSVGSDLSDATSLHGEVDDLAGDDASSEAGSMADDGASMQAHDGEPEGAADADPRIAPLAAKISAARAFTRQADHEKKNIFARAWEGWGGEWQQHQRDLAIARAPRGEAEPGAEGAAAGAVPEAPHVLRERRLAAIEGARRPEGAPDPAPVREPGTAALIGRGALTGVGTLGKLLTKANTGRQGISAGEAVTDTANFGGQLAGVGNVMPGFKDLAVPGLPSINQMHLDTGLTGLGGAPVTAGLSSALVIAEHGGRAMQALAGAGMEKLKTPEEVGTKERAEVARIQAALDEINAREAAGLESTPAMKRIKFRHMVNLEKYSRKLGKRMQEENLHSNLERTMDETAAVFGGTSSRVWHDKRTAVGRDGTESTVPAGWYTESTPGNDYSRRPEVEGGRAAQNNTWRKFGRGIRGVGRVLNHTDKGEEELIEGQYGTAAAKAIGGGAVRVAEDIGGSALAPIGGKHIAKGATMATGLLAEGAGNLIANAAGQRTAQQQDLADLANKYNHGVKISRDADGNEIEDKVSTRREDILRRGYVPRKQLGPEVTAEKAGLSRKDYRTRWNDWRGSAANAIMHNGGQRVASVMSKFLSWEKLGKIFSATKSGLAKAGRGIRRWWNSSDPPPTTAEQSAQQLTQTRDLAAAPGGSIQNVENAYEAKYGGYLAARRARAAARGAGAVGGGGEPAAAGPVQDGAAPPEDAGVAGGIDPVLAGAGAGREVDPRAAVSLDDIPMEFEDEAAAN